MGRTKPKHETPQLPGFAEFHARHALLRIGTVMELLGLRSRTSVYTLVRDGELPPPVKIGRRASGWRSADVLRFIETRQPDALARPPKERSKKNGEANDGEGS